MHVEPCFHCGLPSQMAYAQNINGETRPFCCLGCQAVALAIVGGGLADFYLFRDKKNVQISAVPVDFSHFDEAIVQEDFVVALDAQTSEAILGIEGISCAACAWLIEQHLQKIPGVHKIQVNATNYTCRLVWDVTQTKLSAILKSLSDIGYKARPFQQSQQSSARKQHQKTMLMRLGVAGIGMMQVGMYSLALHAGDVQGIESSWENFFRWIALLVATPVVFYGAWPFFYNAWRGLSLHQVNMDLPVALAIGLAYLASFWATLMQSGDVYFDSLAMFTFFLLLGRYLELRVRSGNAFNAENFSQLLPLTVERKRPHKTEVISFKSMQIGDQIIVGSGQFIPCDGVLLDGEGSVDESLLSGEARPLMKKPQDSVWAGSHNGETPLLIQVVATGAATRMAAVERLTHRALLEKPQQLSRVDRIASKFILFVLFCATTAFGIWWFVDASKAFWIALSILVVTCPCALSLATPTALTVGTLRMKKMGLLVASASFIEKLREITHVVWDKTGTLTEGNLSLRHIQRLHAPSDDEVISIVAALEANSAHPIARAFAERALGSIANAEQGAQKKLVAEKLKVHPGQGVEGWIAARHYKFGNKKFALNSADINYPADGLWQLLTCDDIPMAWLLFEDAIRDQAQSTLDQLQAKNIQVEIVSGDREENVAAVAKTLGITCWLAGQSPEQKLAHLKHIQKNNVHLLMVGDGINDVPGLSGASTSIAMGESTQLAQTNADAVLLNNDLATIPKAMHLAQAVNRIINQNLNWCRCYNLIALPAAALGYVPPYLAAIGMSVSSLVVVLNALRLHSWRAPAANADELPALAE